MTAYWLARAQVEDPEAYRAYTERVPGILAEYGGRFVVRGGRFQVLEGPERFGRFVVVEFPSLDAALACYRSPEYQAAAALRRDAAEIEIVAVEAFEPPPT